MADIRLVLEPESQLVRVNDPSPTISVRWDQAVQQAVINTAPGPTVASRAYGIVHTAMYDAWSAYDLDAISTQSGDRHQRPAAENTIAHKTEAMSYAAYRVLVELFPTEQASFDALMAELGYDPTNTTPNTRVPAGVGNLAAEALMQFRRQDGSNASNGYADTTGHQPVNADSTAITNLEKWTPEHVAIDALPGDSSYLRQQEFLTPHWSEVTPFALETPASARPVAPEPFLLVEGATVDLNAATIRLADGSVVPISPAIVGTDANAGAMINQRFIDQAERVVAASANLSDEQKLIAEFWEDGGGTSFPPGTWMTFGEFVSARDDNTLDEDAMLFFALSNAVFDAGVATWEAKAFYDYARPIRAIRELGKLGLLNGGTIGTDSLTGEIGFVIDAWAGPGLGTQTILADHFLTYQTPGSDPSPPFAEYTSGHSSFSAAGAEILQRFTGSDDFGAEVAFELGQSRFEPGAVPASNLSLSWDSFTEAADEAGLSRIYGGIHFDDGDVQGRSLGRTVATQVWDEVQDFATGAEIVSLQFALEQPSPNLEVGFFLVEDATGLVNGLTPADPGYLEAALAQSSVLFSALPDREELLLALNHQSTRTVASGSFLQFFTVQDGTVDSVLNRGEGNVSLAAIEYVDTVTASLELDIAGLNLSAISQAVEAPGLTFQGITEAEIIDCTEFSDPITVAFSLQREADFDSVVGFYVVDDLTGQMTDASGNVIAPAATADYVQAALNRRLTDISLSAENNSTATVTAQLAPGQIIAPFLIVEGTVEQLLDGSASPEIYFPFMGANADGADHVRLLGNHTFGFEDMRGGGDRDFDDLIVQMTFA